MRRWIQPLALLAAIFACRCASAQQPANEPTTKPGVGRFPGVTVDARKKQVRVECEALNVDTRLEFFCVLAGTSDHESVLRTKARPSDIHASLLICGLTPGEPMKFSEATQKLLPPHGPPLHITCEYQKDSKTVSVPAGRMFRDVQTRKPPKAFTWIFAGSRVMDDGKYAADTTGYVVSLVNFDFTLIDVPELVSNSNETLEWEFNPDTVPKTGTPVTMVIEPAGKDDPAATPAAGGTAASTPDTPATQPVGEAADPGISDAKLDEQMMTKLKARWEKSVRPNANALRVAAQAHYEVLAAMRREQQRLINEADRIQRAIDELEKDYQDMTTPRPEK